MDSSYLWQGMIPQTEIPFQYNPERGFISSANQKPVDETYPYYLGRNYPIYRGFEINKRLSAMSNITPQDMMALQTDNYNAFAAMAVPVFLNNIKGAELGNADKKYLDLLRGWNLRNDVGSKGATVFEVLWKDFQNTVFEDEFDKSPKVVMHPFESSLLEAVLKDTAYKFLDNISTPQKETLADEVTAAFKKATVSLVKADAEGKLEWEKFQATHIDHLAKLPSFSRKDLVTGGSTHTINATKQTHGPSWRMVISLTKQTEAYGVYPGGQSGNPGSRYYDNFIDQWAAGKYYTLWMMAKGEEKDSRIKWVMNFAN
jgi:penicillin G amidase